MHFKFLHFFLSFSFENETTNTFIHSRSFLENHTQFQTKKGKMYLFSPKRRKNHTLWGDTYLYDLFKRVRPET